MALRILFLLFYGLCSIVDFYYMSANSWTGKYKHLDDIPREWMVDHMLSLVPHLL